MSSAMIVASVIDSATLNRCDEQRGWCQ